MEIEKRFPKFEDLVVEKEMEGLPKQVAEGFARGYLEALNSGYFEGSLFFSAQSTKSRCHEHALLRILFSITAPEGWRKLQFICSGIHSPKTG